VQLIDAQVHCTFMLDRTSVMIERRKQLPHLCAPTLDHTLLAFERISVVSSNRPEGAEHHVFFCGVLLFLLFFFVYLFLCLFSFYQLLFCTFVNILFLIS
jgi:hypothetical protein